MCLYADAETSPTFEPTGNLDSKPGTDVVNLLSELNRDEGVTIVCSTHDRQVLKSASRIRAIQDGRLEKPVEPAHLPAPGRGPN